MRSKLLRLLVIGSLMGVTAACGDDDVGTPDSSVRADGGTADAGNEPDAFVPEVDGGSDAGSDGGTLPAAEPVVVSLSTAGHDRLFGVTHDAAGNIYATGQMAASTAADADYSLIVAKFSPAGVLDTTFGEDGIASVNVAVGGRALEVARGIVVQSPSGRIVIAGTAETDPTIGEAGDVRRFDTDIVLVGFTAAGELDATFGDEGITRIEELNDGVVTRDMSGNDVLTGADAQWSLALASENRLVVHGTTRASGDERVDAVWALLRLTEDGELDATFSGDGIVTLDLNAGPTARASARSASVLPDGSIIGSGYLTSGLLVAPGADATQQPVIYKVLATGEFDPDFAMDDATEAPGVWHDLAVTPPLRAEAYGAALQGENLVTMGYGPTTMPGEMRSGTDWISLRYTSEGELDPTYGTSGTTYLDVAGLGDNGRAVIVLDDNRVMGVGGGRLRPAAGEPEVDAMVAVLTPGGLPDTEFADDGFRLYDLAGSDFFWGASLAEDGSSVAIVGVAGAVNAETDNDDSILFVLPVD